MLVGEEVGYGGGSLNVGGGVTGARQCDGNYQSWCHEWGAKWGPGKLCRSNLSWTPSTPSVACTDEGDDDAAERIFPRRRCYYDRRRYEP